MFLKSENVLVGVGGFTKKINAVFRDLFENYQESTVENMTGSDFSFGCLDRLYYGCHKITVNRGG